MEELMWGAEREGPACSAAQTDLQPQTLLALTSQALGLQGF